mmetsp:Transcript_36740/g.78289  ORF Transcript_36740/g.78289 Transcript_36740/m.78289 type:complete len:86 (+) Transcript_36740:61-318(+)
MFTSQIKTQLQDNRTGNETFVKIGLVILQYIILSITFAATTSNLIAIRCQFEEGELLLEVAYPRRHIPRQSTAMQMHELQLLQLC